MFSKFIKCAVLMVFVIILLTLSVGYEQAYGSEASDFYKGKTVDCIVPYMAGGGYDAWVRAITPFFNKYTGATLNLKNVPGGGSLVGTDTIFLADPNGLTIGIINGSGAMQAQLTDVKGVKYDLAKFTWLARLTSEQKVMVVGAKSKFKTIESMQKATDPVKFGAPGMASSNFYDTVLITDALGIKIDMKTGYETSSEVSLAILRGDLDAQTGSYSSVVDRIKPGTMIALAQWGESKIADLASVPFAAKIPTKSKDSKELLSIVDAMNDAGRVMVAPHGLSPDKAKFLEEAISKCLQDPDFRKFADKENMEIIYLPGAKAKQIAQKGLGISPAMKAKLKEVASKYQK
jgi:tripartite-type tricarboxylate transporter receptor subunit TctC